MHNAGKFIALVQGKEMNAIQKCYLVVNFYLQSDPDTGKEEMSCHYLF